MFMSTKYLVIYFCSTSFHWSKQLLRPITIHLSNTENMAAPMKQLEHHVKSEYCTTRPKYREGRQLKAVKVYTINDESQYLLVQGVPAVGTHEELMKIMSLYGEVIEHRLLKNYPAEEYCDTLLVKFKRIQSARYAKKKVDDTNFYGGVLHICYAPEFETVNETRDKLKERRQTIAVRIRKLASEKASVENALKESLAEGSEEIDPTPDIENEDNGLSGPLESDTADENINRNYVQDNQIPFKDPFYIPPRLPPPLGMPGWFPHNPGVFPFHGHPYTRNFIPPPPPPPYDSGGRFRVQIPGPDHPLYQYDETGCPAQPANFPHRSAVQQTWNSELNSGETNVPKQSDLSTRVDRNNTTNCDRKLIVKNPDTPKPMGKLIPRQVSRKKVLPEGLLGKVTQSTRDSVNEELRKQAFVLGIVTGPSKSDFEVKSFERKSATGDKDMDDTVLNIRKRVQEFAAVAPPRQIKKPKKE